MLEVEAWCVCNQLMEGLSVLHKLEIVHGDIKPQVNFVQLQGPRDPSDNSIPERFGC